MRHTTTLNHSPAPSEVGPAPKGRALLGRSGAGEQPCLRSQLGNRLQLAQLGARLPVGKLRQHIQKVFADIDFKPLAGFQHRQERRNLRPRTFTSDLNPVFASKRDPAHGVLGPVVVDLDYPMPGPRVTLHTLPLVEGIRAGLAQSTFGKRSSTRLGNQCLQSAQQRRAFPSSLRFTLGVRELLFARLTLNIIGEAPSSQNAKDWGRLF